MRIATSANAGRASRRRFGRSSWLALMVLIAVAPIDAQQYRAAPRFEGKAIPEPPNQNQPWTPPATKLPRFLVTATADLFEQGVADPRGCEYRQVEVGIGSIVTTRGFVLPERGETPGRFVICWDTQVYPTLSVGEPADLDRDIKDLAANLKRMRQDQQSSRYRGSLSWGFSGGERSMLIPAGIDDSSPLKLCVLLRLGRADLAEALFTAGTPWTPAPRSRDLTNYGITYLSLAHGWAGSVFTRLIGAHARGDDVIALDAARKLAKFRDLVSARADALGIPRDDPRFRSGIASAPRFGFLTQLDDLLRDQERRARMPARVPIPRKGGEPSARITELIRDLDQIDVRQVSSPGAAYPGESPLVKALIAEGDPAVAPLLEVLESDDRLTRSVTRGRGMTIECFVHPVHEAAFAALIGILETRQFDEHRFYGWKSPDPAARKALASSIRQFWEKTRSVPRIEQWYRTLLDDSAGTPPWLEAAGRIVAPDVEEGMPLPKPGTRPMRGEPLRVGRNPSVTALMLRRARQYEPKGNPPGSYDPGFDAVCQMGTIVATWDEKASLPLLKELMKGCRVRSDRWREEETPHVPNPSFPSFLARFTQFRAHQGDSEALDEYAAWLRTTTPKMLQYSTLEALQPLLAHPDHPAMASAARWVFTDPKSPWLPLLPEAWGPQSPHFVNLFASPLMGVAGFREGAIVGLADKTPLGTFERVDARSIQRKIKNLPAYTFTSSSLDLEGVAVGVEVPLRSCDLLAEKLAELEGCPRFNLFQTEPRRDEAEAAIVAYLKGYGRALSSQALPGMFDFPEPRAHLKFPDLAKPATLDDVASARAIFSLEGQGEAQRANLPGTFPLKARWLTLKDRPLDRTDQNGVIHRTYDTDGYIWQAEEVRKGNRWQRFYGFVGHHVVARAPASEIEFASQFGPWANLKGGLDSRVELVEPRTAGYDPGRPIVVAMHIRNRLGIARSSPTEFVRRAPDGKPAFRKGVNLSLWHATARGPNSGRNQAYPNDVTEPKRNTQFDPGQGSRLLVPLEAFEAMRFDLNDWFDLTKPGRYRLRVAFATDSGIGEGSSNDAYFQIGFDE